MTRHDALKWLKFISLIGIYGGLLMPAVFVPVVIFPFVFSKLLFFQMMIGITFPAYLALAWMEPRYRPPMSMLYLSLLAYLVAIGLSTIFSIDMLRSWWGNQERMNGLFTLLHFFAWLSMTVGILRTWVDWKRLLNYEIGLSVFMAVVALLQKPFPKLLSFPAGDRVGGLLDNPIYMAAYQIFNLFFILLLWLKGSSRSMRVWYAIAAAIDVAAFVAAQSRGALVGLGVGVVVFGVVYAALTPNKKARRSVFAAVAVLFIGYGILFGLRNTTFIQTTPLARLTNFSVASRTRFIAWEIAWKGFLERPLVGWGFDTYHIVFNQKYNPESLRYGYYETWFDRSHNTFLDIMSMTGLVGLVTYLAVFVCLLLSVIRAHRRGWSDVVTTSVLIALPAAYVVQNVFVFDHPAAFSMSYLLFAFAIVAVRPEFLSHAGASASPEPARQRPFPTILLGCLYVAALLLVWKTSWQPAHASILSIKSNTAFAQGRYEEAYHLAEHAFRTPTPYLDEQSFLQARNIISLIDGNQLTKIPFWRDWHDLTLRIEDAYISAHPNNTNPHFVYARFAQAMIPLLPTDASIADREYHLAINLSPKRQQLFYGYARLLIDAGKKEQATQYLRQVTAFDEEVGESHWLLGTHLWFDRNQQAEGAKEMIRAVETKAPYVLKSAQETMALALAYDYVGDKQDKLRGLMELLAQLPKAPVGVYVQIAKSMEHSGLIEQRNMILGALIRDDKNLEARLQPLIIGHVTSIDAALKETEKIVLPTGTTTPIPVAPVTTSSGLGPRVK